MAVQKKGGKKPATAAKPQTKSSGLTQDGLKGQAALWKQTATPPPNNSFGDMPDGRYQAKIEEAVIENGGKNRDRLQVKWAFRIEGPTHANRMTWSNTGLGDEMGIEITKRYLATLGLAVPDEIEELPPVLGQAVGKRVEIALVAKTTDKGTFQNCYMNKTLDGAAATAAAAGTEEQISFVGQTVSFDGGEGKAITAKVETHTGDQLNCTDDEGNNWEVGVSDVTIVDTTPPPPAPTQAPAAAKKPASNGSAIVGTERSFKDDQGKEYRGKVMATNGEGGLTLQVGDEEWEVPEAETQPVVAKPAGPVRKAVVKK